MCRTTSRRTCVYVTFSTLSILSLLVYDVARWRFNSGVMLIKTPSKLIGSESEAELSHNQEQTSGNQQFQQCALNRTWPSHELIYNMVPKCGSLGFRHIIHKLRRSNHFTVKQREYRDQHITVPYHLSSNGLRHTITRQILPLKKPWIYVGHLHFIDFQKSNFSTTPVYINIVRDPVERLASFYYWRRENDFFFPRPLGWIIQNQPNDSQPARKRRTFDECVRQRDIECDDYRFNFGVIPHFCGHDDYCIVPSQRALEQAKQNADKHFAVIGYLDRYTEFIEIVEKIFPSYFRGASKLYQNLTENNSIVMHKTKHRKRISDDAREILLQRMDIQLEYEFYKFIKMKFDLQYEKYCRCNKNFEVSVS